MYNVPVDPAPRPSSENVNKHVPVKWVITLQPAPEESYLEVTIARNGRAEVVMELFAGSERDIRAIVGNELRLLNPSPSDIIEVPVSLYLPRS